LIEWFILQPLDRRASRWQKGGSNV